MSTSPSLIAEITDYRLDDRQNNPEAWFARRFVLFCQLLFRDREPGDLKWSEDVGESEIHVTDQVPFPMEKIEHRPAIQLVIASVQNQNMFLDHLVSWDWRTGERRHADMYTGQASFNCHATNDEEARRLAKYVQYAITQHRRDLIQLSMLHYVAQATMGPSSSPGALIQSESTPLSTMVSVMFPFYYFGVLDPSSYRWER